MKWNSRRRNKENLHRGHGGTEVTEADPERSFVITGQTRSGSRTGCRAEATSQLSASRRYMSRKPQGESEKPQGPATTAGAPGYKRRTHPQKRRVGHPQKQKADPSLAPQHARERVLGSRLLGMTMGVGATRSGTGRRYIDRTRAHARGPSKSAGTLGYKRRKAGVEVVDSAGLYEGTVAAQNAPHVSLSDPKGRSLSVRRTCSARIVGSNSSPCSRFAPAAV